MMSRGLRSSLSRWSAAAPAILRGEEEGEWSCQFAPTAGGTYSERKKVANRNWVGTGRQKMVLERWTNPKRSRRTCTCEYGRQSV
jgi:hypothetical protein